MPKFLTLSPTHVPGKKKYAWNNLLKNNMVAIGWDHTDYSGMTLPQVIADIRSKHFDNEVSAIDSYTKLLALDVGDLVAVNNVNHGIFGIGRVTTGYQFAQGAHDNGALDPVEFYSHYRGVEWLIKEYRTAGELLNEDDDAWAPYGTVGKLYTRVPSWVARALGEHNSPHTEPVVEQKYAPPFLADLMRSLSFLREEDDHLERGHESLVEELLVALGHEKHRDIKFQRGRLDITITHDGRPVMVVEVKKDWSMSLLKDCGALKQAYDYALQHGIRYVLITNGDYYALHDRMRGLSYEQNLVGEFSLSSLVEENKTTMDRLRKEHLAKLDVKELLQNLSIGF